MKRYLLILFLACLAYTPLSAIVIYGHEMIGRIDIGPAYARVDLLRSEKTTKRIDMAAIKADSTVVLSQTYGFCVKPNLLYGKGDKGELLTGGIGFGICIPYKCFTFTPYAGVQWTHMNATSVPEKFPIDTVGTPTFLDVKANERFRSTSPFIAIDVTYDFADCWRVCGYIQYAWSRTNTRFHNIRADHPEFGTIELDSFDDKSKTSGPNYGLMIERDINDNWSVNLGAAYNVSLSREKHGLRGGGVKLGTTYWF